MSEAFVNTLKRYYVRINPLPDAEIVPRLAGNSIGVLTTTTHAAA